MKQAVSGMPAARRALVVDDHPVTHIGCRALLGELGFDEIESVDNGSAALRAVERAAPELILLDLGLPGVGGLQLIGPLRSRAPDARILVFTMNESPALAASALEAGASGFLSKNAPPEDLLTAVRAVTSNKVYLERGLAIDMATRSVKRDLDPKSCLTPREHQVLRLIGKGFTYEQIAEEIHVSYKTVANTSSSLKRKLSARSLPDLMRIAVSDQAG